LRSYDGLKSQDLEILWAIFAVLWKNDPSEAVATPRIAPRICQSQPPTFGSHCSRFHRNWLIFGGVFTERVKTVVQCQW